MPFSKPVLEEFLSKANTNHGFGLNDAQLKYNYGEITDYLTGKISSINNLYAGYQNEDWFVLIELITNLNNPAADDLLILNVLFEPTILIAIKWRLALMLNSFIVQNTSQESFDTTISLLKRGGYTESEIFEWLLVNYENEKREDYNSTLEISPRVEWMKQFIKKNGGYYSIYNNRHYYHRQFNSSYFKLLEEIKVDYALTFQAESFVNGYPIIPFFHQYKNGAYLPAIIDKLTREKIDNGQELQIRFQYALSLYELDRAKYTSILYDLANRYFEYYTNKEQYGWENYERILVEETKKYYSLQFSAICLYLFYKKSKEACFTALDKLFEGKKTVHHIFLLLLFELEGEKAYPYFAAALKADNETTDYLKDALNNLQKLFPFRLYGDLLWSLINHKSRPLRNSIAAVLAQGDAQAEEKAIALLQKGKTLARETAANILTYFSTDNSRKAIAAMLDAETNDNTRDILLKSFGESLYTSPTLESVSTMIAAAKQRGKLEKLTESSINENEIPALYFYIGQQLDSDAIRFLFYRMSRTKAMRSDIEANQLIKLLDNKNSQQFAEYLIKQFKALGEKPEHKYLITLVALLGDESIVDKIKAFTNKWIEENRTKMAEYGVGALALQGSNKALRTVEWYSRKYKNKKAPVGLAALVALEDAAEEQNITIHELGDRIVPDFGFDGLFKHFEAGEEQYRAFVDANFKISFFDEDNRKLKSVPAEASAAIKEDFKSIAKEIRDITRSQSSRLEYYMVIQRKWRLDQWQQFFMENPVMFIYATKILWGIYDEDGILLQTFICNEDTSLLNIEQEEINIQHENALIGIVHPTQLNIALVARWKRVFYDLSISPIFPQLERTVPDMNGIDISGKIVTAFEGINMKQGSISSTLLKNGWSKGPVGDGGLLESFNLLYFEKKLEAVLELEGVGAGYGWGTEESTGRFYVLDKTRAKKKYNYIQRDDDERLVPLSEVPFIFLSEAIAAIQAIKRHEEKPASN